MNCRKMFRTAVTAVFVLVVSASFTWAHEVSIHYQAKLGNGPELQPGDYRLELVKKQDTTEAAFFQGENLVVQVPVTIVTESEKSVQTEVHYETLDSGRVINQIRVSGWKERLVFRERPQAPGTNE